MGNLDSKSLVSIERCRDYAQNNLEQALERLFARIGGGFHFIRPGDRVFIKINHLGNHPKERAIATHPLFSLVVAKFLRQFTSRITLGDGLEGQGLTPYQISSYLEVFKGSGIELVNLRGEPYPEQNIPNGRLLKRAPIARRLLECDVLINLPKLKTHTLTLLTGAVKNSYGFIPWGLRSSLHSRFVSPVDFATMLVDLYAFKLPSLSIMDAIVALEGYGPSRGGRPRDVGLILASADGVALDTVAAKIIGYEAEEILTTWIASERGIGKGNIEEIEISGLPLEKTLVKDFKKPSRLEGAVRVLGKLPSPVLGTISRVAQSTRRKPKVIPRKCTGCGICVRHCPEKAIKIVAGKAQIDISRCISCYCCHEFCENDAIILTYTGLGSAVVKTAKAFQATRRFLRGRPKNGTKE